MFGSEWIYYVYYTGTAALRRYPLTAKRGVCADKKEITIAMVMKRKSSRQTFTAWPQQNCYIRFSLFAIYELLRWTWHGFFSQHLLRHSILWQQQIIINGKLPPIDTNSPLTGLDALYSQLVKRMHAVDAFARFCKCLTWFRSGILNCAGRCAFLFSYRDASYSLSFHLRSPVYSELFILIRIL